MSDNYDQKITIKTAIDNSEIKPGTKEMDDAVKSFKSGIESAGREISDAAGKFAQFGGAASKSLTMARHSLVELREAVRARNSGKNAMSQIADDARKAEEATRSANESLKETNKLTAQNKPMDASGLEDAAKAQGELLSAAEQAQKALDAEYEALVRAAKESSQADYDAFFSIDDDDYKDVVQGIDETTEAYKRLDAAKAASTNVVPGNPAQIEKQIAQTEARIEKLQEKIELQRRKFDAKVEDAIGEATAKFASDHSDLEYETYPWETEEESLEHLSDESSRVAQEVMDKFGVFEDTPTFRNLNVEVTFLNEKLEDLRARLEAASQASNDLVFGLTPKEFAELNKAGATPAEAVIEDGYAYPLVESAEKATQEERGMLSISELVNKELADIERQYQGIISKISQAETAMQEYNSAAQETNEEPANIGFDFVTSREEYNQQLALIEKAQKALEKYQARQDEMEYLGVDKSSNSWKLLQYRIKMTTDELKELNNEKARMEAGGIEPEQAKPNEEEKDKRISFMSQYMDEYAKKWQQMATISGSVGNAMARAFTPVLHPLQSIDRGLAAVIQKAGQVVVSLAKMAGHAVLSFLRNLASGAVNAAIQLAKLAGNAVVNGLRRIAEGAKEAALGLARLGGSAVKKALLGLALVSTKGVKGLRGLTKGVNSSKKSLASSLKTLIKYTFGVRSLFFLFRRLRSAVSTGLGEIAKKNPAVKAAMNSLTKSFGALKGSLSTAFAPIVTAVAPALTTLINLLTKAINTIGAFFAALTGQKVYTKSIGAVGAAAKSSTKSVKDLERQLASFDDLDILKANDNSGSGSSSDSSGFGYETVPIESAIGDFVEKLKALFAAGKYEEIGRIIADGLNKAILKVQDFIKWENIGPTVTKIMNALTGAINGLVDGFDWKNLGATIGDGLNTITNALLLWYKGIDWENLGKKFAEGVNGLVDRVNWANLGKLLRERMRSVIDMLYGAVTEFNWGNTGAKFAEMLNSFFADPNIWKKAGDTVDRMLKGILDFTKNFVITFNAAQAGRDIRAALEGIDWPGIASQFWENAKLAFNKSGSFIYAILGGEGNFTWDNLANKLTEGFNSAVKKLTDFVGNLPVSDMVGKLNAWFNKIRTGIDWPALGTMFGTMFQQALNGVGTAIANFSNNAISMGQDISAALNAAIATIDWDSDNPGSVKSIISNGFKGAIGLVKGFFDKFDAAAFGESVHDALFGTNGVDWKGIAQDIWDALATALSKMGDLLTTLFGGSTENPAEKYFRQKPAGISSGATTTDALTTKLSDSISTIVKSILGGIKNAIESVDWKALGDTIAKIDWSGLATAVFDVFETLLGGIKQLVARILGIDNEEDMQRTLDNFEEAYKSNSSAALKAYGGAYGVNLDGLDHDEARRRMEILVNADYDKDKDPVTELIKSMQGEGKSLVQITDELGLGAKQLETIFPDLALSFEGRKDYSQAVAVAENRSAYDAIVEALNNNSVVTPEMIANEFGIPLSEAKKVIQAAEQTISKNTDANEENTIATRESTTSLTVKENYGLDKKNYEQFGADIEDYIKRALDFGNFSGQIEGMLSIGIPEETVHEAAKDFLNKWNAEHPTAPIEVSASNWEELSEVFGGAEAYKLLKEAGVNMTQFVIDGMESGSISIVNEGGKLVMKFADGTETKIDSLQDSGVNIVSALLEGVNSKKYKVTDAGESVVVDFGDGVEEEIGKDKIVQSFKDLGYDIVDGAVIGMGDEMDDQVKALCEIFGIPYKEAADTNETHSPSKLFERLGKWIIEGLMNGLKTLAKRLKGVWDALPDSTQGAIKSILKLFTGMEIDVGDVLDDLSGDAKDSFKGLPSWMDTNVISKTTGLFTAAKPILSKLFGSMSTDAQSQFKGLPTWMDTNVTSKIIGLFTGDSFKTSGATAATNLKTGLTSVQMPTLKPAVELAKKGWDTVSGWVSQFKGGDATEGVGLTKSGWSWLSTWANGFKGGDATEGVGLVKSGWSWLSSWVEYYSGGSANAGVNLERDGWWSIGDWAMRFGDNTVSQWVQLLQSGWKTPQSWVESFGNTVKLKVQMVVDKATKITQTILKVLGASTGGVITAGGNLIRFASGGIIRGGMARYLSSVPHYAGGTTSAHGTVFVAGENGPEVMGHINGRTEILNKSQIADAIYSAVVNGMGAAVNALGSYVANHMTTCANAIIGTIGASTQLITNGLEYYPPQMATGSIMPYDVSAQIARSSAEIQSTLDENNEDLIQTIINVAGQIVSAIQRGNRAQPAMNNGITARDVIDEINRQTMMYGASPLKGV